MQILPQIQQRLTLVDSMISDVLEASSSVEINPETTSPSSLVQSTLSNLLTVRPQADVKISYQFDHQHMLYVDTSKIRRVLTNIIENALQATGGTGHLWFHSTEDCELGKPYVTLSIGNSGSFIEPEEQMKVFDVFYTKGKKSGTGLGLAIAKKLVSLHGGKIWCTSSREKGTEFHLALPADQAAVDRHVFMAPGEGDSVAKTVGKFIKGRTRASSIEDAELHISRTIKELIRSVQTPIRVLVVDDEPIYLRGLTAALRASPVIGSRLNITQARNADEALFQAEQVKPDLIICDVDLGRDSIDGFELVRALRGKQIGSNICVHSHSHKSVDYRRAIDAGADSFMPKPLSLTHLYTILSDILQGRTATIA